MGVVRKPSTVRHPHLWIKSETERLAKANGEAVAKNLRDLRRKVRAIFRKSKNPKDFDDKHYVQITMRFKTKHGEDGIGLCLPTSFFKHIGFESIDDAVEVLSNIAEDNLKEYDRMQKEKLKDEKK